MYLCEDRSEGGASVGVGGGGAECGSRAMGVRLRGMSLGSFALRPGVGEGTDGDVFVILHVFVWWKMASEALDV